MPPLGDLVYLPATSLGDLSRFSPSHPGAEVKLDRLCGMQARGIRRRGGLPRRATPPDQLQRKNLKKRRASRTQRAHRGVSTHKASQKLSTSSPACATAPNPAQKRFAGRVRASIARGDSSRRPSLLSAFLGLICLCRHPARAKVLFEWTAGCGVRSVLKSSSASLSMASSPWDWREALGQAR